MRVTLHPPIVAHRGASADAPENTLAAFREAWRQGADAIEGDFWLTLDGEIVCIHDPTTERVGNQTLRVEAATFAELREIDVGSWKGEKWRGERIPSFAEVMALVPPGKRVVLELKGGTEMLPALDDALAASGLSPEQTIVIAFDDTVIREFKKRHPDRFAHWLTDLSLGVDGNLVPDADTLLRALELCGADGLSSAGHRGLTADWVNRFRSQGYQYHVWTVDDTAWAKELYKMGVMSITTNQPGKLRSAVEK